MTLDGPGTLILGGANSYSGGTYVDAGTLIVTDGAAIPDGSSLVIGAAGAFAFDPTAGGIAFELASSQQATSGSVEVVPEPSAAVLLASAIAVLFGTLQSSVAAITMRLNALEDCAQASGGIHTPGSRVSNYENRLRLRG